MQNAFIESFNSRWRDECLNQNLFLTLAKARATSQRSVTMTMIVIDLRTSVR